MRAKRKNHRAFNAIPLLLAALLALWAGPSYAQPVLKVHSIDANLDYSNRDTLLISYAIACRVPGESEAIRTFEIELPESLSSPYIELLFDSEERAFLSVDQDRPDRVLVNLRNAPLLPGSSHIIQLSLSVQSNYEMDARYKEIYRLKPRPPIFRDLELDGPAEVKLDIALPGDIEDADLRSVSPQPQVKIPGPENIELGYAWSKADPAALPPIEITWIKKAYGLLSYRIEAEALDYESVDLRIEAAIEAGPHPLESIPLWIPDAVPSLDGFRAFVNGRPAHLQVRNAPGMAYTIELGRVPAEGEMLEVLLEGSISAERQWAGDTALVSSIPTRPFEFAVTSEPVAVEVWAHTGPGVSAGMLRVGEYAGLEFQKQDDGSYLASAFSAPSDLNDRVGLYFRGSQWSLNEGSLALDGRADGSGDWTLSLSASPDPIGSRPTRIDLPLPLGVDGRPLDPAACRLESSSDMESLEAVKGALHAYFSRPVEYDEIIELEVSCPLRPAFVKTAAGEAALILKIDPWPGRMDVERPITASASVPSGLSPKGYTENGPKALISEGDRERLIERPALYGTELKIYVPSGKIGNVFTPEELQTKRKRVGLLVAAVALLSALGLGLKYVPAIRDRVQPLLGGWPWKMLIVLAVVVFAVSWLGIINETMLGAFVTLLVIGGFFRLVFGIISRRRSGKPDQEQ